MVSAARTQRPGLRKLTMKAFFLAMSRARNWPLPSAKNSVMPEGITSKGIPYISSMAFRLADPDARMIFSSTADRSSLTDEVSRLQQLIIAQFPSAGKRADAFAPRSLCNKTANQALS